CQHRRHTIEQPAYPGAGDPRFIDWVDYGDRNAEASPEQFLADVAERIPADATVYMAFSPTYKTFEGQCEQLLALLSADRDATQAIPMEEGGLDEFADLWIFRPRA
ncbi:MAG: hypothetical protein REI45_14595, partial [Propionicimonas sp.]|nr:hypothetical protein [Propionicimonas sp.]